MAKGDGAELLIAHATSSPARPRRKPWPPASTTNGSATSANVSRRSWSRSSKRPGTEGVEAKALVLSGTPDEAITEAAKKEGADLVIVGTHGRKGVSKFFLGSVASRVITTAPCPVLTVHAA